MTETGITEFGRGLGDVVATCTEQFSGALHSQFSEILGNGQADFARKHPAQVKRTATDFLAKGFQRQRIGEVAGKKFLRALDPLTRHPLLPHTEKFRILWLEEEMRHQ